MLGDGRTMALVARDGRIDWWPIPTLDSPPICAAILDPDGGGHFRLTPEDAPKPPAGTSTGTNVLETTYTTPPATVRVTEALNIGIGRTAAVDRARPPDRRAERRGRPALGAGAGRPVRAGAALGHRPGPAPVVTVGDQNIAVVVDGAGPATSAPTPWAAG